jgi:hypothetical protein
VVRRNAPFPERVAVGALAMRFVADFHHLMGDWATWASERVRTWEHPDGSGWDGAYAVFESVAAHAADDRPTTS